MALLGFVPHTNLRASIGKNRHLHRALRAALAMQAPSDGLRRLRIERLLATTHAYRRRDILDQDITAIHLEYFLDFIMTESGSAANFTWDHANDSSRRCAIGRVDKRRGHESILNLSDFAYLANGETISYEAIFRKSACFPNTFTVSDAWERDINGKDCPDHQADGHTRQYQGEADYRWPIGHVLCAVFGLDGPLLA